VYDLPHIPQHFLAEVAHFFSVYKDLEGVHVKTVGWERAEKARERILHAVELYQQQYPPLSPTPQV
jgi:inorganic pyrophosphatase